MARVPLPLPCVKIPEPSQAPGAHQFSCRDNKSTQPPPPPPVHRLCLRSCLVCFLRAGVVLHLNLIFAARGACAARPAPNSNASARWSWQRSAMQHREALRCWK